MREKTANPPFEESDEDLDELNAHRRAENWIRRFNQQNYQAWNTTKGRPYVELGNIFLFIEQYVYSNLIKNSRVNRLLFQAKRK